MLHDVAELAARRAAPSTGMMVRWVVLLVAAAGSFGYGLAVAATWFALATFMLDGHATWRQLFVRLAWSSIAVAILYVAVHRLHSAVSDRAPLYGFGEHDLRLETLTWSNAVLTATAVFDFTAYGIANLFVGPIDLLIGLLLPSEHNRAISGAPNTLGPNSAMDAERIAFVIWIALLALWLRHRRGAAARQAI